MSGSSTVSGHGSARDNGAAPHGEGSLVESSARRARREAWEQDRKVRRKHNRILIWSLLGLAVIIAGLITFGIHEVRKPPAFAMPRDVTARGDGLVVGGLGPVTVDVYADYQCTGCRAFQAATVSTLERLMSQNEITLIYHPIATLDGLTTTHYSTRAADAAACAANMGMFLPFSQALFAEQPPAHGVGLSDDELIQVAGDVGIIDPRFAQCVRAETYKPWVARVTLVSAAHRVDAVPIVLVNGSTFVPAGATPTAAELTGAVAQAAAIDSAANAGK
jgi:protein-disulfide isomerase